MKPLPAMKFAGTSGLTRRSLLRVFGAATLAPFVGVIKAQPAAAGAGALLSALNPAAAAAKPACIVRPEQTEGPYFVDEKLNRSDIRSDPADGSARPGAPLRLAFRVSRLDGNACSPLSGAIVDVWQCDADGIYSGVRDFGGLFDTRGRKFLRGYQVTDATGTARFLTIYPGWYPGRTVHIHFKIRSDPAAKWGFEYTSQLYFDDAVTDQILAQKPYAVRGPRTTRNAGDGIFRRGGSQLLLDVSKDADGYAGIFDIGLQLA